MTRIVLGWLLAAVAVISANPASAAPVFDDKSQSRQADSRPRHKWWQDERFTSELGLTDQQAQEVEQIFQANVPRLRQLKDQLDQQEQDLSKMIRERTAQETAIAQQVDRVESTRSELSKVRTLMLYRMHRVLTSEQNEKLRAILDREHRDRKENQEK